MNGGQKMIAQEMKPQRLKDIFFRQIQEELCYILSTNDMVFVVLKMWYKMKVGKTASDNRWIIMELEVQELSLMPRRAVIPPHSSECLMAEMTCNGTLYRFALC